MKIKFIIGGILLVVLGALVLIPNYFYKNKTLTIENVGAKDATYLIENESITFKNGLSEMEIAPGSASKKITKYFGNEAVGDLNNDNKADTVFLLTQESGGSGTFFYVAVLLSSEKGYVGTNAILLGDRIAPQTTEIKDGKIVVNYADRKVGEPFSVAPSVGVSKYLKIESGKLVEIKL
jgi:hypothetical protein